MACISLLNSRGGPQSLDFVFTTHSYPLPVQDIFCCIFFQERPHVTPKNKWEVIWTTFSKSFWTKEGRWEPDIKDKEQNCISYFLSMQLTITCLLTSVDVNDAYEAMVVSRHLIVNSKVEDA